MPIQLIESECGALNAFIVDMLAATVDIAIAVAVTLIIHRSYCKNHPIL